MLAFPIRCWIWALVTHLVISFIATNAGHFCVLLALHSADVTALNPASLVEIFRSPASVGLFAVAVVTATVATLLWIITLVSTAKIGLSGYSPSIRAMLIGTLARARKLLRPSTFAAATAFTLLAPLVGFSALTPALDGLHIPPFIGREFAKVPLTAVIWYGGLAAIACLTALSLYRVIRDLAADPRATSTPPRRLDRRDVLLIAIAISLAVVQAFTQAPQRHVPNGQPHWFSPSGIDNFAAPTRDVLELSAVVVLAQIVVVLFLRLTASGIDVNQPLPAHLATRRARALKRRTWTAVLIVAATCATAAATPIPTGGNSDRPFTVLAHRGYDIGGPENTIAGLEAAAPFDPDYVEVDVLQVADGTFIASHDTDLLPLAGRGVDIQELTSSEAARIEVSMHGNTDRVPTMKEYVAHARELGVPLLIELKVTGLEHGDVAADMLRELEEVGRVPGTMFHSLDAHAVEEIKRLSSDSLVGLTLAMHAGPLPALDADFFVVEQASITREMIDEAHAQDAPIYAWTVNDVRTMHQLWRAGVDGVVTDSLPMATALRDE